MLPDREALVSGDGTQRVTYEQMASRVLRLANALQAAGVSQGDRVGVTAGLPSGKPGTTSLLQIQEA